MLLSDIYIQSKSAFCNCLRYPIKGNLFKNEEEENGLHWERAWSLCMIHFTRTSTTRDPGRQCIPRPNLPQGPCKDPYSISLIESSNFAF